MAAATWILVLTALATIAVAVPKALDLSPDEQGTRPRSSPSVSTEQPADQEPASGQTREPRERANCEGSTPGGAASDGAKRCPSGREPVANETNGGSGGAPQEGSNGVPGGEPPNETTGDASNEPGNDNLVDDVIDQVDEVIDHVEEACALLPPGCPTASG